MYTVAELKKELEDCRLFLKTHEVDQEHFDAAYKRFKVECEKEGFKPALTVLAPRGDSSRFDMDGVKFIFHTGCFYDFARGFGNATGSVIKDYNGCFLYKAKAESVLAMLEALLKLYRYLMNAIDDDAHA